LKYIKKRKMKRDDFRSRIDPKPPINEETIRENLEREN